MPKRKKIEVKALESVSKKICGCVCYESRHSRRGEGRSQNVWDTETGNDSL